MKLVNKKITIMNRKTIRILMLLLVAMGLGIGEAKAEDNVKYVDADGQTKYIDNVTVLTGNETVLGSATWGEERWYVTSGTTTFNSVITLYAGVHIILADGTTMTVPGFSGKIGDVVDIIKIYSQGGTDEGKLTINITDPTNTNAGNALWISNGYITINGGIINITAVNDGILGGDRITFNGGKTEIKSSGGYGIYSANVIVNGGQLTVTSKSENYAGIYVGATITLGWTNPTDDFIKCSSYNTNGSVKTADGKSFAVYDGNDFLCVIGAASGNTTFSNSIGSLSNKKLCPFEGKLVPVGSVKYYAYNLSSGSDSYKPLNPGVSVYLVTGIAYNQSTKQYEAVLSEAQPGVVPNVPVIFGADKLPNSIALKKEDATVSLSATPSKNFIACDGTKKVSELLPSGVNFADVYFFGLSGNSFKRVLLGSDDVHPAGTCFLFISKDDFNNPPSSAPAGVRGIGIETDGTTSLIGNGQLTTDHAASAQWYSLDGRRLDKAPKTKGVYIRNGKKLVIK